MSERKFEVFSEGKWMNVKPNEVKVGELFRMYNSNGLVEVDGKTEFIHKKLFSS